MANKKVPKKTQEKITAQTESENTTPKAGNYTGYFYNQINSLWREIIILQEENVQLKAQIKGEY